jgi:hypothetical protein
LGGTIFQAAKDGGVEMTAYGENNAMWKGGRSVTEHGYVLIRVGKEHHLADVRGYAYEHRIVAEQKLGRALLNGEQVHHRDGNRSNNSLDNIEIVADMAHHKLRHRRLVGRRSPDESNPRIECACGCGTSFFRYDESGRPRRFVTGHNMLLRQRMGNK